MGRGAEAVQVNTMVTRMLHRSQTKDKNSDPKRGCHAAKESSQVEKEVCTVLVDKYLYNTIIKLT